MPILGIDEVGRGPWAGPLVIGAVVLPTRFDEQGNEKDGEIWQVDLADSKKLTAKKREKLSPVILEKATATGLGWVSANELDRVGLSVALKIAACRAVLSLLQKVDILNKDSELPKKIDVAKSDLAALHKMINCYSGNLPFSEIIIDGTGNFLVDTKFEQMVSVLPKADAKIKEVSAASIIAKVARDDYMKNLVIKYPKYGFEKHVGYGTATHKAALEKYGPCPEHRKSFAPIKKLLKSESVTPVATSTSRQLSTTKTGTRAEQIVADYLKDHGHKILARNYKTKFYEIDIVSATKDHIYFTEVKYRKTKTHGAPLEYIDQKKQQQITFAANAFMKVLAEKLHRKIEDLPSPILAGAAVSGPDFTLEKWLEIMV